MRKAAPLICIALLSCTPGNLAGGAGAGNPPQADVVVSLKASSGPSPAAMKAGASSAAAGQVVRNPDGTFSVQDSVGNALTLSAIEVRIQKIEFTLPTGITCADIRVLPCLQNEAVVKGPYDMDLMTGEAAPAINFIKLPEGIYTRIDLALPGLGDLAAADTLASNMTIRGRVGGPSASIDRLFELKLNLSDGLEFSDSAGVRIKASSLNKLVLSLSVDGWFQGADMRACVGGSGAGPALPDSAGIAQIRGDGACGGLGLRVRRNIEASSDVRNEGD